MIRYSSFDPSGTVLAGRERKVRTFEQFGQIEVTVVEVELVVAGNLQQSPTLSMLNENWERFISKLDKLVRKF